MKIAIILGPVSTSQRPLDFWFNNIFTNNRGATGSDIAFCMIAKEFQKLNHEVHMFTSHAQPHHKPDTWEGCRLHNLSEVTIIIDDSFDAIISLNEPDVFRILTDKPLRLCYQFLNDFKYCQAGFEQYVDQWVYVCEAHKDYLFTQSETPTNNWNIVPLGVDPSWYKDERVEGRVVWTSSADRGLHNLLEIWPQIKKQVPHASLRIFYHFDYGNLLNIEPNDTSSHYTVVEMANRLRYILSAVEKLKPLGVEHVKSVSRNQMIKELNEASVFAFPCDTVTTTEGYSVSTLESHASYTVPIITDQDCLGSIYKNSGAIIIESPVRKKLLEFTDAVVKALTDKEFADGVISKCREFANTRTWQGTAQQLEKVIINNKK